MKKYRIFYSALCVDLGKSFGANSVFSEDEVKNRGKTGQVHRCLPRDGKAMRIKIYRVMTQEAFIAELDRKGYLYKIEGDRIVVTGGNVYGSVDLRALTSISPGVEFRNEGSVDLGALTSLPPGVEFRNKGDVDLRALISLPPGVEFRNRGDVYLSRLPSLPPGVEFRNRGHVDLRALTSISPGVEFRNRGHVILKSLTSLPPGVEFRNKGDVNLKYLVGGWISEREGNIEGIDSKRLLNVMIKQGVFER